MHLPVATRDHAQEIFRRSALLVGLTSALDALWLALLGQPQWLSCALLALAGAAVQAQRLRGQRFGPQLTLLLLATSLGCLALALQLGAGAGFHLPLFAMPLLLALAGAASLRLRWLQVALSAGLLVAIELLAAGVSSEARLGVAPTQALRAFHCIVLVLASVSLVLQYDRVLGHQRRRLEDLATRDGLTGLLNRRALQEAFERLQVQRLRRPGSLALVLVDLDHFKSVNDRWGHEAGDCALRHAANLLAQGLRRADLVARWGGEEFVLLLPDTELDGAAQLAERLRASLAETPLPGRGWRVTATLGLTPVEAGEAIEAVLARADRALYAGKRAGRDRVVPLRPAAA